MHTEKEGREIPLTQTPEQISTKFLRMELNILKVQLQNGIEHVLKVQLRNGIEHILKILLRNGIEHVLIVQLQNGIECVLSTNSEWN